jgi:hypothetical protein
LPNFPCICGHDGDDHEENEDSPLCVGCANDGKGWNAMWHEFRLDNLKYLEKLSESRD